MSDFLRRKAFVGEEHRVVTALTLAFCFCQLYLSFKNHKGICEDNVVEQNGGGTECTICMLIWWGVSGRRQL